MRILYLTDQVYLHGGAEKILIQKLNYWAEVFGYEVALVTSVQKGNEPFFPLSDKVKRHDLDMDYPAGSLYHPKNFGRFREQYKKLKAFASDFRPDAVFVLSQSLFHIITPFACKGFPTYFEYHTSWLGFKHGFEQQSKLRRLKSRFIGAITRFAEGRYTRIVYLNQAEYDYFKRENSIIIPNFYDVTEKRPDRNPKNIAISLGRLSFHKGYDLLLQTWAKLDSRVSDWEMHVYGNGEDREKLQNELSKYEFRNAFKFFEATDKVNEKLSEASIYVMSSRFETFPMVLLEAMSNGLPIASFDCPTGPSSIVTPNEDGLLVKPYDTDAFADTLVVLMQDPDLRERMGQAGLKNVKRFSPELVMRQWDDLVKRHSVGKKT